MKYRPFSHTKGFCCLLPGTTKEVEIFPALVRLYELQGERRLIEEIPLPVKGPVDKFTIFQDLEKGCITVTGTNLYYHILPEGKLLFRKKAPSQLSQPRERLLLGIHKKMHWESIYHRLDFREIFPLWLAISYLLPPISGEKGSHELLDNCRKSIANNCPEKILEAFRIFFLVAFRGMLVPRFEDADYQGVAFKQVVGDTPLHLLKEGASLIRALFFQEVDDELYFLPRCPPQFSEGQLCDWEFSKGLLDMRWSKKKLFTIKIKALSDSTLLLHFPSEIKSFRLQKEKTVACGEALAIKSGEVYLLDCFSK